MNFCHSSEHLVKSLLPGFAKSKVHRQLPLEMTTLLSTLYDAMVSVDVRAVKPTKNSTPIWPKCVSSTSKYFPEQIQSYIKSTPIVQQFVVQMGSFCTVYVSCFRKLGKKEYMQLCAQLRDVCVWITLCKRWATTKTCAETLQVHVFLTPFEKKLPADKTAVLSADNVNSAFTLDCAKEGEIVVYRAEEWLKVLIHETFHTFGLDIGDAPMVSDKLQNLFAIESDFRAAEAYAETFARIINCAFCSLHSSKQNKETFLLYMEFGLQLERIFAIYQAHKILHFMGTTYKDIVLQRTVNTHYHENTNVFAYYILTAIFLGAYPDFLVWCAQHNWNTVQYARGNEHVHRSLNQFIDHHYLNLQESVAVRSSPVLHTTARMSVL